MMLNRIITDAKEVFVRDYIFLLLVFIYSVFSLLSCYFYVISDYVSVYVECLVIAFSLSCIACRDSGLKILRFDFQFRITFAYLALLIAVRIAMNLFSHIDDNFHNLKDFIFNIVNMIYPKIPYEDIIYELLIYSPLESLFYGMFSPLIYAFVCLCFSLKKMADLSIANLLKGIALLLLNGFCFGVFVLFAQTYVNIYVYTAILSTYYVLLTVLTYVVGKNSFVRYES